MSRRFFFINELPLSTPTMVGHTRAFFPPSLSSGSTYSVLGSPLHINYPPGILIGDLLLYITSWREGGTLGPVNQGFSVLDTSADGSTRVLWKIADGTEADPLIHLITNNNSASRSGCMIAFRNAVLGNNAKSTTLTVPTVNNPTEGSTLVAFGSTSSALTESMVANGPLVERRQHVHRGVGAYMFAENTILATEENLPAGSISGRSFSDPDNIGSPDTFAIIVENP